jgi:large subunit ribosomal protein L21
MKTYAVFETSGKQYLVTEGQELIIAKAKDFEPGKKVSFDEVLLIFSDDKVEVGKPNVAGAKIESTVTSIEKGKKINVIKFRAKSRYRRKTGHRQTEARIKIEKISN